MKSSEYIKSARKRLGLTQAGFAELIGDISRCCIADYETERSRVPGDILLKIQEIEKQINTPPEAA